MNLLKYDKSSLNHLYFYKNFKLITDDIRKKSLMKKLINKNEFIIPLAALVGAPLCEKFKDAISTIRRNKDDVPIMTKKQNNLFNY